MNRCPLTSVIIVSLALLSQVTARAQNVFLKSFKWESIPWELNDSTSYHQVQPPSNSVSQIAITGSNIFIGTGNGLAKSTNGGRTWVSYHGNSAFANDGIFAVDAHDDTVWASTGYDTQTNDASIQTGSGYAFSTDGGKNWTHAGQPLDTCIEIPSSDGKRHCQSELTMQYGINDSVRVLAVTTPVANVSYDVSLSPGTVWVASWSSGLRKSTDNGATWQRILLPLDIMNSLSPTDTLWSYARNDSLHLHRIFQEFNVVANDNLKAFSVLALGDTIWCGTAGGVNRSTDGGVSWVKFNHRNQQSPILGNWVIGIGAQLMRSGTYRIWTTNWKASDISEDYGVSYTDDDGRTWINLLRGVKAYHFAFKDSIAYLATDEGIYRTADGGKTLVKFSSFVDPQKHAVIQSSAAYSTGILGDTIFVCTGEGIARTIDNSANPFGSSWSILRTYQQVGTSNQTYAYPNPFSPSFEQVRIHYGASQGSTGTRNVRIDIFDFGMNRVRTLLNASRPTDTEFDELWDGLDDGGRVVANGVYFYRIKVDDSDPIFGKILVLQ